MTERSDRNFSSTSRRDGDGGVTTHHDEVMFRKWLEQSFPHHIWVEFGIDDCPFSGLFIFSKLCLDSGRPFCDIPELLVDRWWNDSRIRAAVAHFSLVESSAHVKHTGPSSDDSLDCCSCLLCRWRRVLQVLLAPTHAWSSSRLAPGVKRLVEEGIPSTVREHVWLYLSGGLNLFRTRRPNYLSHFPRCKESPFADLIDLDIQRTFADDPEWRQKGYDISTRRILLAYADRNKSVGYCQGLSFIVGILVTVANEEIAFLILCAIVEDNLLPPDYYTSLAGAMVDQQVLELLVDDFFPSLRSTIPEISFMSIPWNMCLFSANVTRSLSVRIWDFLFAFGPCVLFRISLGILSELANSYISSLSDDIRSEIKFIESRLNKNDILCFMQRFEMCDNDMIQRLREKVRTKLPPSKNTSFAYLTVRDSESSHVSENFLKTSDRPMISSESSDRRIQREIKKRTIQGLGDFMGQSRRR